jgi:hypothetical protein
MTFTRNKTHRLNGYGPLDFKKGTAPHTARAISFRAWRTTTAPSIQAVGSSQPPSWAAFSKEAAAFRAIKPAMSPDCAARSAASAHLSRSVLHSYHNTGFSHTGRIELTFLLGICITSRATSMSIHLDPTNIVPFVICVATRNRNC